MHPEGDGNDSEAKEFELYYVSKGELLRVEGRMMIEGNWHFKRTNYTGSCMS